MITRKQHFHVTESSEVSPQIRGDRKWGLDRLITSIFLASLAEVVGLYSLDFNYSNSVAPRLLAVLEDLFGKYCTTSPGIIFFQAFMG